MRQLLADMYSCGWYGDDLGNKKEIIHAKHELSKEDILGYLKELHYTVMEVSEKK